MTMSQDEATIQKLIDAFAEAFNRGDTASMATMYTEDAYLLPPQADIMRGGLPFSSSGKRRASKSET
jgi:ketosteroid isomerase-like protein